jgi:hypothetical protein
VDLECRLDLLGQDLRDELATDGEIRVCEVIDALSEDFGDAVGPAAVAARQARLRVPDSLCERVADSDVPRPRVGS